MICLSCFSRPFWVSCLIAWGHLAQGQATTTFLATVDKCRKYTRAAVCVSAPLYEQLPSQEYRNLTLCIGDGVLASAAASSAWKRKQRKADPWLLLAFDYRVAGHSLFYFSSLAGPVARIPPACRGQDELLFCLTDPLKTSRSVAKGCQTLTSQLTRKEILGLDTCYTYTFFWSGSFDAPHLQSIVFDQHFQVKGFGLDTRAFSVISRKRQCEPDSILYFR
jgi:hypothetical protein